MSPTQDEVEVRQAVYDLRLAVTRLRARFHETADVPALDSIAVELADREKELRTKEEQLRTVEAQDAKRGLIVDNTTDQKLLGKATTQLEVQVRLRMEYVPTGICHLFTAAEYPLISCSVFNADTKIRRLRVTSSIEHYSANAVDTVELNPNTPQPFDQLPILFPERIQYLHELTRATLNLLVEDLDGRVELHRTYPIWLLARNTAPLEIKDPTSGKILDMTPYLGAFVTPNEPSIQRFLRRAAERHPFKELKGYQDNVTAQVRALFDALKHDAGIVYVDSLIAFDPAEGATSQRVRLPRESLSEGQANCIDGTLLMASLLEAISLNPAIVIVPKHAMVAWEDPPTTSTGAGTWHFLETVRIGTHTFEQACSEGDRKARFYDSQRAANNDDCRFYTLWSLRELRTTRGVTPAE
jgi:hypothetical protein